MKTSDDAWTLSEIITVNYETAKSEILDKTQKTAFLKYA